jgi:hypothetical protein
MKGVHLGGHLPLVKPNPQKIWGQSANSFLNYSQKYKIKDVHLTAILDFGWCSRWM